VGRAHHISRRLNWWTSSTDSRQPRYRKNSAMAQRPQLRLYRIFYFEALFCALTLILFWLVYQIGLAKHLSHASAKHFAFFVAVPCAFAVMLITFNLWLSREKRKHKVESTDEKDVRGR